MVLYRDTNVTNYGTISAQFRGIFDALMAGGSVTNSSDKRYGGVDQSTSEGISMGDAKFRLQDQFERL